MNAPAFQLHPQLVADCVEIGDLGLCRILLMDDARYPWAILVPKQPNLIEITDLEPLQRTALYIEVEDVMQAMRRVFSPHKLNVAALGNSVRQLHIHVIARQQTDEVWPLPVWGRGEAKKYEAAEREATVRKLAQELGLE